MSRETPYDRAVRLEPRIARVVAQYRGRKFQHSYSDAKAEISHLVGFGAEPSAAQQPDDRAFLCSPTAYEAVLHKVSSVLK